MDKLFRIFKVDVEEAMRINDEPPGPHTHDFEELIVGVEGTLEHFIDFETTHMEAPFASFVTKGKMHRVIPGLQDGKCNIWVLRFKSEFVPDTTFQLYAHYHDYANIQMESNLCHDRMVQLCQMMADEMKRTDPDMSVVRHLLSALFAMIEGERKKNNPESAGSARTQNMTFKSFLQILEENYKRPEGVEFYADKLFMSSRNLNIICRNILDSSVSEIIETRKMTEAKNQLIHTDRTIAEIGFDLGYNENAYFTRAFKRKEGMTPSEFREEMQKQFI